MRFAAVRRAGEGAEAFLAALAGRGGGSGWYDDRIARRLARLLPQGALVLDVGANNGAWAVGLARALPGARFHLFECAPYCFADLERAAAALGGAPLNRVAVSDREGEATLHLPAVASGLASLHPRGDTSVRAHAYQTLAVPAVTLDAYMDRAGIARVDLLKIDVEGHERAVLAGAEQAFARGAIGAVLFEFGSSNVNSRTFFRDFWAFFEQHGFRLLRFAPGGHLIPVPRYDDRLEYFRGPSNYLALRDKAD